MSLAMQLATGGDVTLLEFDGASVALSSPSAAPPGAPLTLTLTDGECLQVKVRDCRRVGERFELRGRCVNLTRALRARLEAALP